MAKVICTYTLKNIQLLCMRFVQRIIKSYLFFVNIGDKVLARST